MLRIHILFFAFVAVSTALYYVTLNALRCVVLRYVECIALHD